ncbi:hypothetical protein GWK47_014061 [Chionoecetes opilio]|uniref:Uncharacterized protein n=1 Tax=Chionoecetes opilio TaxID=41210 RepID=A0A8J4XTT4_CHIOP|nr:hypothetical protein GWK47_014061 [Chionoecetes opilio]
MDRPMAEPRRRRKWTLNPRGSLWANGSPNESGFMVNKRAMYEPGAVMVCSQKRACCVVSMGFAAIITIALIVAFTKPVGLNRSKHNPLPSASAAKRLIYRVCCSTWNKMLGDALRITSMGQYHSDSSSQLWIRKKSRILDVALTRLRLCHTTLTAHLHCLRLSPEAHNPWCRNVLKTIEHFLLHVRASTPTV